MNELELNLWKIPVLRNIPNIAESAIRIEIGSFLKRENKSLANI